MKGPLPSGEAPSVRVRHAATGDVIPRPAPSWFARRPDWRDWFRVFDGGSLDGDHDPWAYVERHGDVLRLTLDADETDGPFFDVPVDRLRELLAQVEEDLVGSHALAGEWLRRELPDQAVAVAEALGRAVPAGRVCRG